MKGRELMGKGSGNLRISSCSVDIGHIINDKGRPRPCRSLTGRYIPFIGNIFETHSVDSHFGIQIRREKRKNPTSGRNGLTSRSC